MPTTLCKAFVYAFPLSFFFFNFFVGNLWRWNFDLKPLVIFVWIEEKRGKFMHNLKESLLIYTGGGDGAFDF